jgi:cell division transport system permease protein
MNLVGISTVFISLSIVGVYLVTTQSLNSLLHFWEERAEVVVFLREGGDKKDHFLLQQQISRMPGVKEVLYVSKEEAWNNFTQDPGIRAELEELGFNPLPASFRVKFGQDISSLSTVEETLKRLSQLEGVEEVVQRETAKRLIRTVQRLRLGILMVGLGLALAAVFTISNTIRLTIYSRRQEIEIMKLMGATNSFVRTPFLVEGALQGFIGGALTVLVFYLVDWGWKNVASRALWGWEEFFPAWLNLFSLYMGMLIIFMGIVVGIFGSFISLRRYLKI